MKGVVMNRIRECIIDGGYSVGTTPKDFEVYKVNKKIAKELYRIWMEGLGGDPIQLWLKSELRPFLLKMNVSQVHEMSIDVIDLGGFEVYLLERWKAKGYLK